MENERNRILLARQKEQILAEVRTEIHKHEVQADSDRRSIQELNVIIESQRREIDRTIASVSTTPQMTCFRGANVCSKWLQERSDDKIIQPDNKFIIGLKVRIQNWL